MLGQFSFPQFLQGENNPHSVWMLQSCLKQEEEVVFKSFVANEAQAKRKCLLATGHGGSVKTKSSLGIAPLRMFLLAQVCVLCGATRPPVLGIAGLWAVPFAAPGKDQGTHEVLQLPEVTGAKSIQGSHFLNELNGRSVLKALSCLQNIAEPAAALGIPLQLFCESVAETKQKPQERQLFQCCLPSF